MLKIQLKDQSQDPVWLVERLYTLGSGQEDNFVIKDPSVSPRHAQLITLDNKLYLKDNKSRHGSYVNEERVDKRQLVPGDVLRLGQVEILILDPKESVTQQALTDADLDKLWSLVSTGSWLTGQNYYIRKNPSVIGRGSQCDIVVAGAQMSRRHAELSVKNHLLHVRDLGSANGTFINDHRIEHAVARPGDTIKFDVYSFRVAAPDGETDNNQTKVRAVTPLPQNKPRPAPKKPPPDSRKWKTRPTSPGNRIEDIPTLKSNPWITLLTVTAVITGVVAVGYVAFTII